MTTQTLSYLMRYLLIPLLVILVWVLLREALVALRRAMRRTIQPARDVFLLGETAAGQGLLNLPVFSITTIGRAPSCDVRLLDESVAARHAMIYLFDGEWFLRPLARNGPVSINGVRIQSPTPLEDQDELLIGERCLTFMYVPEYTRLMAEREAWAEAAASQDTAGFRGTFRTAPVHGTPVRPSFQRPEPLRPEHAGQTPYNADSSEDDYFDLEAADDPAQTAVRASGSDPAYAPQSGPVYAETRRYDAAYANAPQSDPAYAPQNGHAYADTHRYDATHAGRPAASATPPAPALAPARSLVQHLPRYSGLLYNLLLITGLGISILLIPDSASAVSHAVTLWYLGFFLIGNLYLLVLPRALKGLDPTLLLCFLLLTFFGLVIQTRLAIPESLMVREAVFSSGWAARLGDDLAAIGRTIGSLFGGPPPAPEPGVSAETLTRIEGIFGNINAQYISIAIGLLLLVPTTWAVARTRMVELFIPLCTVLTPLFLIATLVLGNGADSHGATLWINVGGFSMQLTEFAKITYLIVVAGFFKNRPSRRMQLFFALWAGLVFFLIMLLPDLGSAMILLPTTLLVYVVMTSEYITTLLLLLGGTGVGAFAYAIFPHVQRRIIGWTTLWSEVNDSNRQIVYGLQAMVRGGLFGRGLGNGSPGGIPLASSDMIFSVISEELGLITGLAIVGLFIIIWLRATTVTVLAPDGFRSSLALAIGTMLFVEAIVVTAGTTGLMPLTGATLPLIAKGGSSALAKLLMLGILLGLSVRPRERAVKA